MIDASQAQQFVIEFEQAGAKAPDASGRDGKARASAELESSIETLQPADKGTFLFGGNRGHFYFALTPRL